MGVLVKLDPARVDARVEWVGGRRVPTLVFDDGSTVVAVPAPDATARARAATLIGRAVADLRVGGFGRRLRELCRARGVSGPVLATLANYSRGYVWELTSGRKMPSADVAEVLDRLLDAGGDLTALATGEQSAGGIGEVRSGAARLSVGASAGSSLVTLLVETPTGGDSATLAELRDLAVTGRARVEVLLDGTQVAELVRLLAKATEAVQPRLGEEL